MSQENVEVVRASAAAYIRGDLDATLKDFDPDVVTKCDRGHTQIAHTFVSWSASWQSHEQSPCPRTPRSR